MQQNNLELELDDVFVIEADHMIGFINSSKK